MSAIRWLAVIRSATGSLEPFLGEAGIAIEYSAPSEQAALRLARLNRLPAAVRIISTAEYERYRQQGDGLAPRRQSEVAAPATGSADGTQSCDVPSLPWILGAH